MAGELLQKEQQRPEQQPVSDRNELTFTSVAQGNFKGKVYETSPDGAGIRRLIHDLEGELEIPSNQKEEK